MALDKRVVTDELRVDEYGAVSVRDRTDILDGDVVIASTYHRRVIDVGASLEGETPRVAGIARAARIDALERPADPDAPTRTK